MISCSCTHTEIYTDEMGACMYHWHIRTPMHMHGHGILFIVYSSTLILRLTHLKTHAFAYVILVYACQTHGWFLANTRTFTLVWFAPCSSSPTRSDRG